MHALCIISSIKRPRLLFFSTMEMSLQLSDLDSPPSTEPFLVQSYVASCLFVMSLEAYATLDLSPTKLFDLSLAILNLVCTQRFVLCKYICTYRNHWCDKLYWWIVIRTWYVSLPISDKSVPSLSSAGSWNQWPGKFFLNFYGLSRRLEFIADWKIIVPFYVRITDCHKNMSIQEQSAGFRWARARVFGKIWLGEFQLLLSASNLFCKHLT